MSAFHSYFLEPFIIHDFMRRALIACLAVSISGAPLGVFLVLRRMSLVGDAISHAILPGVALAFIIFGMSLWPMIVCGIIAAILVTLCAGVMSRFTSLKEETSFSGIYLISLAIGVLIMSMRGHNIELVDMLFGNILVVSRDSLMLISAVTSFSVLVLALIYRNLVLECFDHLFVRSIKRNGFLTHQIFLMLIVLNLVCAFQVLGTLMAIGMIILPAISTRFWTQNIDVKIFLSILFALLASYFGLIFSFHYNLPSGPIIVLVAGFIKLFSACFGSYFSLRANLFQN